MFGLNPYFIIGLIAAFLMSNGTAYYYGGEHAENRIHAEQLEATNKAIVQADVQSAKDSEQIKFIEVEKEVIKNVYIKVRDQVNENIEKNTSYAECALDADGLRLFNASSATKAPIAGK